MINAEKFGNGFMINIQFGQIEIVWAGQPPDGRLECASGSFGAVDDPFQHTHVLTETGPQKFSVRAFAEPVYAKNWRRMSQLFSNSEPMLKIVADVVSAEWQHRHW